MWCYYFMVWAIRRRRKAMFMCTRMVSRNFAGSRLVTSERTHSRSAPVSVGGSVPGGHGVSSESPGSADSANRGMVHGRGE